MKISMDELEHGVRLILLEGKLDSLGVEKIEMDFFRYCGGTKHHVLIDLSRVSYISSIGIPMLVDAAKDVLKHGGKMALVSPQKHVMDVLELVGVSRIIPIYPDLKMARASM